MYNIYIDIVSGTVVLLKDCSYTFARLDPPLVAVFLEDKVKDVAKKNFISLAL